MRGPVPAPPASAAGNGCESNFTPAGFARTVDRIKEFIAAGDIYQANLSQRFRTRYEGDPFRLFLGLRQAAPAPFSAFLEGGDFAVVSMSPERFLHLDPETRRVETRPIKGTRPRGQTVTEDRLLARELVQSGKDRAEHVMIVDLERNDLGRVAPGGHGPSAGVVAVGDLPHAVSPDLDGGGGPGPRPRPGGSPQGDVSRRVHHRGSQDPGHAGDRRAGNGPAGNLHRIARIP